MVMRRRAVMSEQRQHHRTQTTMTESQRRIAVIGGGITGLTTAWIIQKHADGVGNGRHQTLHNGKQVEVTLFEKEDVCGGHTRTVDTMHGPIDIGFQVFNLTNYENLTEMFEYMGIDSEPSEMSFSYTQFKGNLADVEWSSNNGIRGIFTSIRKLLSPSMWRLLFDLMRFERQVPLIIKDAKKHSHWTLEDFLINYKYSKAFKDFYIIPMCCAIWSSPKEKVSSFSLIWLLRFIHNHHLHLVTSNQRPLWRVVRNGTNACFCL